MQYSLDYFVNYLLLDVRIPALLEVVAILIAYVKDMYSTSIVLAAMLC